MSMPYRIFDAIAHRRRLLCGAAAIAAIGSAAHADSLTISSATTAPLTTAAAANSSAGDITIDSAGSVIVTTTGPAVTVNSNNNLTNGGSIQSSATTGATAILIDATGGINSTYTTTAATGITGTGGSSNVGLRVANGTLTGSIASSSASTIAVNGTDSFGVSIESPVIGNITLNSVTVVGSGSTAISLTAPLTGSLRLTGTSSTTGGGGYALHAAGDISGSLVNAGTLIGGATSSTITASDGTTSTGGPVAALAVVAIEGDIGGGFLNDRYYVDANGALVSSASVTSSDTLITGAITGYGGTTAVLIKPATANAILLSPVGAAGGSDAYGFINRGTISSAGSLSGTAATAVSIAGTDVGGTVYGVTLQNGLANQTGGTISATAIDATAHAIDIGAAASVPTIVNAGVISATASNSNGGGSAFAILVEPGAAVSSITNSGTIAASSAGSGSSAYAILDLAGTFTSVTNSGTINVSGGSGNVTRAIDLSAGSAAETVTNSGKISGDIAFGSGNASYIAHSGALSGTILFGSGSNLIQLDGASSFTSGISLASGGTVAVALGGTSSFTPTGTVPTLASLSATDQAQIILTANSAAPSLTIAGAASFTGQSSIKLVITQNPGTAPITVLTAGGGITTDHAATLLSGTSTPYLFTLDSYSTANNALTVTLHQKSASEIGLDSKLAPLFDQSFAAFGNGATFQAIANLPDQTSMLAAYRQILPASYGSMPVRIAQSLQSAGNGMIAARLDAISALPSDVAQGARMGVWVQQGANFLRHDDSQDDPGFKANSYNLALGGDYALSPSLVIGASGGFAWNDVHVDGTTSADDAPFGVVSETADIYAGWHGGPFFVQAIGSFGHSAYKFERAISFGSFSATQQAKWSSIQYGGELNAGLKLHFGRFSLQPSNALSFMQLHQSGYTENGGGDIDLKVAAKDDKTARNSSRLALGYDLPMLGGTLSLAARGAYVVELDKSMSALDARFVAGGTGFSLASAPLEGNAVQEGLAVSFRAEGFYIGLSGDRRQQSGYSDTSAAVTMRINF